MLSHVALAAAWASGLPARAEVLCEEQGNAGRPLPDERFPTSLDAEWAARWALVTGSKPHLRSDGSVRLPQV